MLQVSAVILNTAGEKRVQDYVRDMRDTKLSFMADEDVKVYFKVRGTAILLC